MRSICVDFYSLLLLGRERLQLAHEEHLKWLAKQ